MGNMVSLSTQKISLSSSFKSAYKIKTEITYACFFLLEWFGSERMDTDCNKYLLQAFNIYFDDSIGLAKKYQLIIEIHWTHLLMQRRNATKNSIKWI